MDSHGSPNSQGGDVPSESRAAQEDPDGPVTVKGERGHDDDPASPTAVTGALAQLQRLIAQMAAAPVTREFAAKAAELAAVAAEKAGPAARSLADRTEVVGQSVVDRATTFALAMRSDETAHIHGSADVPAEGQAGS